MSEKFTKSNLKTLAWPKDATHVQLTHGKTVAVVSRKDVVSILDGCEGVLTFGAKVKKEFIPLAAQPASLFKTEAAKPTGEAKAKPASKAKTNGESHGALGGLFGFAVTSVLRRLGKEGVSTSDATAILNAKSIKASPTTVSIQVNAGRTGTRGAPANLTGEQVKALRELIPVAEKK